MKTKGKLYTLIVLVTACLLNSCDEIFNCLDGNGIQATEKRYLEGFTGVENTTAFDVEIYHDVEFDVMVTADSNLIPFINTEVLNGKLVIDVDYNHCLNSYNPILIELHMPMLDDLLLTGSGSVEASGFQPGEMKFRNTGSGNITAWNFECEDLNINNSGSGEIDITDIFCSGRIDVALSGSGDASFTGNADKANYLLSGSGSILADHFPVNTCIVANSGSGDVYCNVHQSLNIVLSGSGNVYYSGTPADEHELVTGSGGVYVIN
jgi:hypothetical protein